VPQLDRYRIGEVLGEGGIGRVHAAYDTVLGRDVAIKSLRPARVSDPDLVERFRAEATNLARLDHPHVTTVFDLIEHGRSLYIIMERVHGPTLEQMLRQRRTGLGVAKSIGIFGQAADGLAYAHSKGVIHRDIKPANIMITSSGLVKIMDFGIARLRDSQRMTRDGQIIGTLAYMAPEQLRGEPADERSDLYSLAMVLYEMLTGSPPFKATSDQELFQAQLNAKPRRLRELLPGIDPRIDAALSRALAKKPSQRFASVAEFRDALDADSARSGSRGSLHRTMQFAARALPSAHAKLSDLSDKLVLTLGPAMRARLERIPAKRRLPLMAGATALIAALIAWGALMLNQGSVAAREPATPTVVQAPQVQKFPNSSVILAEPELHAGRMK
jgi:eukaryotic-like serine/threonine-protein kinase